MAKCFAIVHGSPLRERLTPSRIAHAYAGLDLPELNNVKVPGTPNAKRALHFYMKAAKQGRSLGVRVLQTGDER